MNASPSTSSPPRAAPGQGPDADPAAGRSFGRLLSAALLAWSLLRLARGKPAPVSVAAVSAAILAVAELAPALLLRPRRAWIRLGEAMSVVTQPVILGAVFYGVVTPFGWWRRLRRKSPLLGTPPGPGTFWIPADPARAPGARMRKQF